MTSGGGSGPGNSGGSSSGGKGVEAPRGDGHVVSKPPTGERLMVVEDEAHLAEVIADNLELEGWAVEVIGDGSLALERILAEPPDLVLLDVMLPGMDGFEICARVRAAGCRVPILFLTARSARDDRVRGLEAGGDDYLGKPFDLMELILRVRAILRRAEWYRGPSPAGDTLRLGDVTVDFAACELTRPAGASGGSSGGDGGDGGRGDGHGERRVELSTKETMILRCLAEQPGKVVSRAEIVDRVWGYDAFPTLRTVDNFILRLRRLLEPDPKNPRFIHTVRGTGYRLTP
jgi:two-component system alkaline phosphatase synthesis response regulator PhoP